MLDASFTKDLTPIKLENIALEVVPLDANELNPLTIKTS
jgi:hypothetical protein